MTYLDLTESTAAADAAAEIPPPEPHERSLGELVASAAADLSTLVRKEVALAKAEISGSVKSAGIGAGALGGAGLTAMYGLLFLSLAAMFGLEAAGLPPYGAALVMAAFWLLATCVLGLLGSRKLGDVGGVPRTAKTLKEDVEWARHPTS